MKNKYNTEEERKEARRLTVKKYNDKVKEIKKLNYLENKEVIKHKNKTYYDNNKSEILKRVKEYEKKNKEKISNYNKKYYNENKDKIKNESKKYRELNKENKSEYDKIYRKNRMKYDIIYLLKNKTRKAISTSLKRNNYTKKSRSYEILGCSFEELKQYLESKFEDWMTWENRGLYNGEYDFGWDIDHKVPLSSAKTEEELLKLYNYTNLQPLCSKINRDIKKDKTNY